MTTVPKRNAREHSELLKGNTSPLGETVCNGGVNFSVFAFDPHDAPAGLSNYWGYSPISFFAPHSAYSSRKDPLGPLNEFRDMVKALHRAGIEVILDVVYNHTAEGDHKGPTFCDRGFANDAYYSIALTAWSTARQVVFHYIINAYWKPLTFQLPSPKKMSGGVWHRWIDTSRPSPEDIVPWDAMQPVTARNYRIPGRSVVVLITRSIDNPVG